MKLIIIVLIIVVLLIGSGVVMVQYYDCGDYDWYGWYDDYG